MDEPGESCLVYIKDAVQAIDDGFHKVGLEKFQKAIENAIKGKKKTVCL